MNDPRSQAIAHLGALATALNAGLQAALRVVLTLAASNAHA